MQHSYVGASSANRWMKCPASVKLSQGIKSESSSFASEGTAAHELAERCLKNNLGPIAFFGDSIEVNGINYEVTLEMVDAVERYTEEVSSCIFYTDENSVDHYGEFEVEVRFDLNWLAEGMFGTCDATVLNGDTLYIIDFKYGAGVPVSAEDNPQLKYYALGALGAPKGNLPKNVELIVVQPRIEESGVTRFRVSTEELYDWGYNVLKPAVEATRVDNPTFSIGSHCRWCKAFGFCPHLGAIAEGTLGVDFNLPVQKQNLDLPDPELMTIEQRARVLEFSTLVKPWFEAVYKTTYAEAMNGVEVPGYKLVQRKLGNRKWSDEKLVIANYGEQFGDAIYEPRTLISPASMERLISGKNTAPKAIKEEVTKFTSRAETGLELKPLSDKREAVSPQNVDNMLEDIYGGYNKV